MATFDTDAVRIPRPVRRPSPPADDPRPHNEDAEVHPRGRFATVTGSHTLAAVESGLLTAQVTHGPGGGMAIVHLALVAIIVVGGLAFVVVRGRRGSDRDAAGVADSEPDSDPGPEA